MCCYIVNSSTSGFATDPAFSITEALRDWSKLMHQSFIRMVNQHPRSKERDTTAGRVPECHTSGYERRFPRWRSELFREGKLQTQI